jgi:two-component system sensor histidine kinase YesM
VISVKEELAHAENYLTIQKMRYKDQFEYRFEVDDSILGYKTQKLLLQPIIENAIYHGIRQMVDEGEIIIRAYEKEAVLYFEVEDNGLGMHEEVRTGILANQDVKADEVRVGGVGVTNVYERIKLMYGEDYGINIESEIEEGTKITLSIPVVKGDMS